MITLPAARAAVKRWVKRFGLTQWDVRVKLESGGEDFKAACSAAPEYRMATIVFDAHLPKEELEVTARHEVLHIVVWPLAHLAECYASRDEHKLEAVRLAEEGLVSDLTRITAP